MWKHLLACGMLLGIVGAAVSQETAAPKNARSGPPDHPVSATPATQPQAIDQHWSDIARELSSDDFEQRQSAQKELEKATWKERDLLKKLADATPDAEAKARVEARIEQINDDLAINPPPISLDVKNANLLEVLQALDKEMHGAFSGSINQGIIGRNRSTYTLAMKEKPFWEIFQALSAQHGIAMRPWNDMALEAQDPGLQKCVIVGSMAVFPKSITRMSSIDFQQSPDKQDTRPSLNIQFTIAVDPRVEMSKVGRPTLTEVIDDAGNVLLKQDPEQELGSMGGRATHVWEFGQALQIPDKPGKRITSLKGELRYQVQLASRTLLITDVEKKLKQPQDLGKISVTISRFDLQGNAVNFLIEARPATVAGEIQGVIGRTEPDPVHITFIDADGKRFWTTILAGRGSTGGGVAGAARGPIAIELKVPTKVRDVVVPFELKDLPIPVP